MCFDVIYVKLHYIKKKQKREFNYQTFLSSHHVINSKIPTIFIYTGSSERFSGVGDLKKIFRPLYQFFLFLKTVFGIGHVSSFTCVYE